MTSCAVSAWQHIPSAAVAVFPRPLRLNSRTSASNLSWATRNMALASSLSYKQLVSDQLGVDADRVDVIMGDTDRTPSGLTGGSRALAAAGPGLSQAGRTTIDKRTQLAPHPPARAGHDG